MANGPKERVNVAITALPEKSVENKSKDLKCSTLEYRIIVSNQRGKKKKGEGGQQLIAGQFKIGKIAVK